MNMNMNIDNVRIPKFYKYKILRRHPDINNWDTIFDTTKNAQCERTYITM